ncbi:tryptophan synthase beta chain 1-like [Nymphaea colorata]|nr:tryptophan synthase beta chain 1-like [Nymphaea colorata]
MEATGIISNVSRNITSCPAVESAECDQRRLRPRPSIFSLERGGGLKRGAARLVHASNCIAGGAAGMQTMGEVNLRIPADSRGRFGSYGGQFVPETLITPLRKLEDAFSKLIEDSSFQMELQVLLRDYAGRESPLYYAEKLSNYYKEVGAGVEIYLKREDLIHTGSHKINNAIGQALAAKKLGYEHAVAATGAGQHGVAAAAACARMGLSCTVFMGTRDMERQPHNLLQMRTLGAEVRSVEGNFKDAASQAIREWVSNLDTSFHLSGSLVGPHPCPSMVGEFQSVIGKEVRKQATERWGAGKLPDVVLACVGSGSNAMGIFSEFLGDQKVRLIGVEAAGLGLGSGRHSATLARGEVGVFHGSMSYLLQDDYGQMTDPHSIGVGLEYPGVGPQLSFLKDIGRVEYYTVTDAEAVNAFKRLCALEGIIPALEASHALAFLDKLCPQLPHGSRVVVNISGRGDKDAEMVLHHIQ